MFRGDPLARSLWKLGITPLWVSFLVEPADRLAVQRSGAGAGLFADGDRIRQFAGAAAFETRRVNHRMTVFPAQ